MKKKVALIVLVLVIVAASVVALAACNNATSIEKRLVKAGFTVEGGYVGNSQDAEMPEGLQWYLSADRVNQRTMTEDYVAVYCFEKAAQKKPLKPSRTHLSSSVNRAWIRACRSKSKAS